MDRQRYIIYGLVESDTGFLRYVGKSTTGLRRPRQHSQPSHNKGHSHRVNWLRALSRRGATYETVVLEEHASGETLSDAERHFIAYFRSLGCDLVNTTEGGDGGSGVRSSETRARIAAAKRGRARPDVAARNMDQVHRAAVAAGLRGTVKTESHRQALARSWNTRAVVDEAGVVHKSQHAAARALGVRQGHVAEVLAGARKTAGGHTFKYAE